MEPPLAPEQFVKVMDTTASYVTGRGLPLLMMRHYGWMMRYPASYFEHRPSSTSVTVSPAPTIPVLRRATVSFRPGRGRVALPALVLSAAQVAPRALQLLVSLTIRLGVSALQSARVFARLNIAAAPPLVAAIVIVFLTGDAWKILAQGFDWRFATLLTSLLVLSLLVVADLRHLRSNVFASDGDFEEMVSETPAEPLGSALAKLQRSPQCTRPLSGLGFVNTAIIYVGMIMANLLVIGSLVAAALVFVGVIRIDAAMTAKLTNQPAHVLLRLPIGHMVVTRELLSLSLSLGGLAAFSFAVAGLPSAQARVQFVQRATAGLRRVLTAHAVYEAALDNEYALTGVSSRRPRARRVGG